MTTGNPTEVVDSGGIRSVLIISTAKTFGGGERYVERVAGVYRALDFSVVLITACPALAESAAGDEDGFSEILLVSGLGAALRRARGILARRQIQIVHLNGHRDIVLAPLLSFRSVSIVGVRHTELIRENRIRSWVKLLIYSCCVPFADAIVCVSETVANQARRLPLLPWHITIPNWIPDRELPPPVEYRESPDIVSLLIVARLDPTKGHALLFEAMSGVSNVELHVVGDGPVDTFKGLCEGLRVEFHGFSENVNEYYGRCDIFVLPTYTEGSPLGVIEAMGAGLPILVSDIPAIREIVVHGNNGYLFRTGSSTSLAKALKELSQDVSLRKRLGQAAREYILAHRTEQSAVRGYSRVLSRLNIA